jgi:hypothetical protein
VRVKVLSRRILKIFALLMVTVMPRSALSDANLGHVSRLADMSIRQLVDELDPTTTWTAFRWARSRLCSVPTTMAYPM